MTSSPTGAGEHVHVRPMRAEDIPDCVRIVADWIASTDWVKRKDGPEAIEPHFHKAIRIGRTLFVAQSGQKVAGYLSLDDNHYIQGLYVDRTLRGTGIGKALIGAAKNRHPDYLDLGVSTANNDAQRFYEREGFLPAAGGLGFDPDLQTPIQRMRWWGYGE